MDRLIEEFRARNTKATLKDIVNITGLSLSAVSQALNPSSRTTIGLSEKSIERVRDVAKKINYRTHWGAISTRSNFLYNIAYLKLESDRERSISAFLPSFCKVANAKNFSVSILSVDKDTSALPTLFKNNRLDAIVVEGTNPLPTRLEADINGSNIPRVSINRKADFNAVYVDEYYSASEITNYLIERLYKDIVFLKPNTEEDIFEHHSISDRERGYLKAMKNAGLSTKVVAIDTDLRYNQRLDMSWLDFDNLPEAILAYDDDLANAVAKFFYRKGIHIPRDMSLASFGGGMGALSAWCPLTTMAIPHSEMGKKCFDMLFRIIEKDNKEKQKAIPYKSLLIIGESTK